MYRQECLHAFFLCKINDSINDHQFYCWNIPYGPCCRGDEITPLSRKNRRRRRPTLTSLRTSGEGSWGLRHAWATLMTCSSFRGCSSTLAARKSAAGAMTWWRWNIMSSWDDWQLHWGLQVGMTKNTYISVKSGEWLDHVESMHVHDGGINCELGPDTWWLKEQRTALTDRS